MLSIFESVREQFIQQYQAAPLDLSSFHRRYKSCAGGCHALCCSGGAGFYYAQESDAIRRLVASEPEFFAARGIPSTEAIFDEEVDDETGEVQLSTNTRPFEYPAGIKPAHFDATACIFREDSGACSLQVLAMQQGKDGWWHKPVACWLFPIELERDGDPFIHVAHASTDEYVDAEYPGFVGFTRCGAECKETGTPAYLLLQKEIATLSKWLERDLLAEILAYGKE